MFKTASLYTIALLGVLTFFSSCKQEYEDIKDIDDRKIQQYLLPSSLTHTKDPSGFYYQVLDPGTGAPLLNKDSVLFTFDYKSLGGTVYYSTTEYSNEGNYLGYISRDKNSMYPTDAFRIALSAIKRGGKVRVILPSYLAFGKNGLNNIPSNEVIVADVVTFPQANQTALDDARIAAFLSSKGITATRHSSGVYYVVTQAGTGESIELTSTITAKYTGRLLTGTVFEETTGDNTLVSRLSGLIPGWQKVLPLFKQGAKVRLFVPSVLAYGTQVQSDIPANSCLDFDMEITAVTN